MRIEIKYQINETYIMKKLKMNYYIKKDRYINFKELVRSYVEIENRSKALEEKADKKILLTK